jgi:hypothetical protein
MKIKKMGNGRDIPLIMKVPAMYIQGPRSFVPRAISLKLISNQNRTFKKKRIIPNHQMKNHRHAKLPKIHPVAEHRKY